MARSKLWLPFAEVSTTLTAGAQVAKVIDDLYLSTVGAEFKGTLLAGYSWVTVRQDAISNSLEQFSWAIRVASKQQTATDEDIIDKITRDPAHMDVVIGGPGADTTVLANVMQTFTFPFNWRSKRTVGFNEQITFVAKGTGAGKIGIAGRMLLLEA